MKRISRLVAKILFVFLALIMVGVSVVKAREEGGIEMEIKDKAVVYKEDVIARESEVIVKEEVNYYLPYPGLLPDHPLYFLKMMRDRLKEWKTFDQARKAEYFVNLADKRMGAGRALIEGDEDELGVTTYRKASRYLKKAIEKISELEGEGREMGDLANRIEQATLKYDEVMERSGANNPDLRGQIEEIRKEIQETRNVVLKILDRV